MTEPDLASLTPLEYAEITDISVLGGTVPAGDTPIAHVFLAITVGEGDDAVVIHYGMSPWGAIRLGVTLGEVAIQMVDIQMETATAALGAAKKAPDRREHSAYL